VAEQSVGDERRGEEAGAESVECTHRTVKYRKCNLVLQIRALQNSAV
jgi:hypothetical protein